MYKAKRQGPNVIEMFDEPLRLLASERLQLLSDLRHAAGDGELRLFYQPVLNLEEESAVGVEALVRWEHPTRGRVPPDEFIPFAERSGLIIGIGDWVIREACRQAARWKHVRGTRDLHMSVNISGRQLASGAGLVQTVRSAIDEAGIDPTSLILEVTESALMDDAEAALRVVNELKALGLQVAIDDFGTGYSSLVYLKRFPVDILKVDRTFVAGLGSDHNDTAIVHSVIDLAHAFGITAIAEGIETVEHLKDMDDAALLLEVWQATGDPAAARRCREYVRAWAGVYKPTGNDVNEAKLMPLFTAYEAMRGDFPAAERIGANSLLVRIGAYFHDIGKMLKPHYFVENQAGAANRHANLAPAMSTLIIIGHVKDGADLGRQHHLPEPIIDLIEQHHGTTLVEYFYREATRRCNGDPDAQSVSESATTPALLTL